MRVFIQLVPYDALSRSWVSRCSIPLSERIKQIQTTLRQSIVSIFFKVVEEAILEGAENAANPFVKEEGK